MNFIKKNKIKLFITTLIWFITLIINTHYIKDTVPITTYLYPISKTNYFLIKYIILEIFDYTLIFSITYVIEKIINQIKNKNNLYKLFVEGFIISFLLLITYLIFNFPGQWAGDSIHLLEYARSLRTIPWHNIYTSLFYIISFSLIPHAAGVVIFQYIFISCIIGYIYSNIFNKYKTRFRALFFIILLTPINLFYANWVFRTTICGYLELLTIFYIIFNLENIITSKSKKRIFIILVGFISSYRSENILYILIPIIFINRNNIKEIIKLFITCLIAMILINLPQKIVSKKYYNSDYLITNTYETLQYITNYISEEDIKKYYTNNIRNIIPEEYIRNYGQHAYFEYNYENTDHGTTLNKSQEEQKKYLVDIAKLFFKYKKLYLFNKINGFTEMLYGKTYFPVGMTYSKRTEYFFQKQSDIIKDKFKKEYSYKKDQNPNICKKLILPFIITILLLIVNLFKKNKIVFIYILLLIKSIIITFICPITVFMYYYYLYLISYYVLVYELLNVKKKQI